MTKALLFDWDGTSADTAPDIYAAAVAMLTILNLPLPSADETRSYIGDGMTRFVKRVLTRQWRGEPDAALLAESEKLMKGHYERECTARNLVYDGVLPPASRVVDSLLELCDDVTGEFLLHKGEESYVSA